MDTIVFDGVEYVKASVAAKQFRYTTDYIGQLCRAKKIDARLVGRAWFVNLESLKAHKKQRYHKTDEKTAANQKQPKNIVTSDEAVPVKRAVAPRLKSATLKQLSEQLVRSTTERKLHIFYEPDEANLIPPLHRKKTRPPKIIHVEPAGAKKVAIAAKKRTTTTFSASDLPDIALSGQVKITDYPEQKTIVTADDEKIAKKSTHKKREDDRHNHKNKAISVEKSLVTKLPRTPQKKKTSITNSSVPDNLPGQPSRTGAKVAAQATPTASLSFTPTSVQTPIVEPVSVIVLISPLIATFLAVAVVIIILSLSTVATASSTGYESHLLLRLANLTELFLR